MRYAIFAPANNKFNLYPKSADLGLKLKMMENTVREMDNNEMVNQTVNTAEQTVNTAEQTVNTAEQTVNTAERQTDTAEQQTDAAEQTESAVEMRDQMLHQSVTKGQWHYCFHTACPQASTCFRQISTKYIPEDSVVGNAIFPTAYKSNGCRFYVTPTISTLSWGFSRLFDNVPHKSVMQLRNDMKRYFRGSSNYYKYHRGEKKLTPMQQADIAQMFKKYDCDEVIYDHCERMICLLP